MMKQLGLATCVVLGLATASSGAQSPGAATDANNTARMARGIKARYDNIKRDIVEAADAVPESEYGFKPTPEVRSFGQLIGHIADAQNFFCGVASGANPEYADTLEKAQMGKADLVKALHDSMTKCDEAYTGTDASNVLGVVKAGKGDALRGMTLLDNVSHDNEHYGNIVTYMRLKGHVPPSTARTQKSPAD